jgi:hypothetical protein
MKSTSGLSSCRFLSGVGTLALLLVAHSAEARQHLQSNSASGGNEYQTQKQQYSAKSHQQKDSAEVPPAKPLPEQPATQAGSRSPVCSLPLPKSGAIFPSGEGATQDSAIEKDESSRGPRQDGYKYGDKDKSGHSESPSKGSAETENDVQGKQTKRILWIFPNYRSVSADTQLPYLSVKQKLWLATQDSFDYSSFILAGAVAGLGQAQKQYSEFHQGAAGYGRYFWRAFVDQAVGNYFTEAIVPALTREDPRYYTLGHGSFFRRAGYALSRLVVTRTDQGGRSFNFSEIVGNGAGAAISNLYYPSQERTFSKTGAKWATQVGLDGLFNILKEFWPDINHAIFHGKY